MKIGIWMILGWLLLSGIVCYEAEADDALAAVKKARLLSASMRHVSRIWNTGWRRPEIGPSRVLRRNW